MQRKVINSVEDFLALNGSVLGKSSWIKVDQTMINLFADVTKDYQWIHVDESRAKQESAYQSTIAHGYLTLSLLPHLLDEIFVVNNLKQVVNYSIDKIIFRKAVPADSSLRLVATLKSAKDLGGICQARISCVLESETSKETVLEGDITFLYYFDI
jgi:acyl dehydratase